MKVFSDLHLEFEDWRPTAVGGVVVLAGDVAPLGNPRLPVFLQWCVDHYDHVLYVAGNHEFYGKTYPTDWENFEFPGVTKLDNTRVVIDGQGFCGATLWTDLSDHLDAVRAQYSMNDYRVIRGARRELTHAETTRGHRESVKFLRNSVREGDVVITHHLPSYSSVNPVFHGDPLNSAFATELGGLVLQLNPSLWIHGHSHCSVDYMIGNTRVFANPKGYRDENSAFDHSGGL